MNMSLIAFTLWKFIDIPPAKGVEKGILHVNSRSNMIELIICTCITLANPPLPRLIYKPRRIATWMKNLSQIH